MSQSNNALARPALVYHPTPPPQASSSSQATSSSLQQQPVPHRPKDKLTCYVCSPPLAFETAAKKASHAQVVHQSRVRVTSDTGLFFYVDRKDNYFHCPRDRCPHTTPNTVSFGLHVRHTCKQPWPQTAPDPPEADLAKDVKEEAEGKKRRRGGGRGKGAMKKRATTTTTPPAREDSPSKEVPMPQEESASEMEKEEDDLESEFERAWEADFAGWNPFGKIKSRRVVDILHRLPLLREEALSMLRRIVSADPMMSAEKGQRVRRLQEDIARQKGEVLYFARWHINSLQSISRPDLQQAASLVLEYLPFGLTRFPKEEEEQVRTLRRELLDAIQYKERTEDGPYCDILYTLDNMRDQLGSTIRLYVTVRQELEEILSTTEPMMDPSLSSALPALPLEPPRTTSSSSSTLSTYHPTFPIGLTPFPIPSVNVIQTSPQPPPALPFVLSPLHPPAGSSSTPTGRQGELAGQVGEGEGQTSIAQLWRLAEELAAAQDD